MNFSEIRPEDVFNWLMGVNLPFPGVYLVFGAMLALCVFGSVIYHKRVERDNEKRKEAERIAAEHAEKDSDYNRDPGSS